nr:aminotransferase class IV [Rhodohalobacter sp. 614A]
MNDIILNGELISEAEATIPAVTSGLYYGAGAFETFLSENGEIFKYNEHIKRLNAALKYLGLSKNMLIDADSVLGQIKKLLQKNNLLDEKARIRIQVSLSEKPGYSGKDEASVLTIISASGCKKPVSPQHLVLSDTSVVPSSARPTQFKLSNMLHYRQAFREAEKKEADDAILLTIGGFVAETSIANIFWLKDGDVYTPSKECDILPGIMRKSIVYILREELGYEVNEGKYSMDELLIADAVWLTNSAIDFVPVSKIEGISFDITNGLFSDLSKQLSDYKKENMIHV